MKAGLASALKSSIFFNGSVMVSHLHNLWKLSRCEKLFKISNLPFESVAISEQYFYSFIVVPLCSIDNWVAVDFFLTDHWHQTVLGKHWVSVNKQTSRVACLTLLFVFSFLILLLWLHFRIELSISELCSIVAACTWRGELNRQIVLFALTASSISSAVSVRVLIFLSLCRYSRIPITRLSSATLTELQMASFISPVTLRRVSSFATRKKSSNSWNWLMVTWRGGNYS